MCDGVCSAAFTGLEREEMLSRVSVKYLAPQALQVVDDRLPFQIQRGFGCIPTRSTSTKSKNFLSFSAQPYFAPKCGCK